MSLYMYIAPGYAETYRAQRARLEAGRARKQTWQFLGLSLLLGLCLFM